MINNYSYPEEFKDLIKKIQNKYGKEILERDGIGEQLDVNAYSKAFYNKQKVSTTADISIDANANIEEVTVLQYMSEITKPVHRLNSYFLLWKYSRELFSSEIAEKIITDQLTKAIYINDFHSLSLAYCFNFSCIDVIYSGLPFTKKVISLPPKNLSSFMGQMINFITYAGNNIAGACGVSDLLICAAWYVDKLHAEYHEIFKNNKVSIDKFLEKAVENIIDKSIKQEIQSFIYSVNQPFRGGVQSFFTNITIFDDVFLDKFCEEYQFPDQVKVKKETIKKLQNIYVDLMNETLNASPITFPVTTAAFAIDNDNNILDNNFLKYVSEKNLNYGFMNIYAGKTSTLSSCCRLRNDASNSEYFNAFGSGGSKIGSLGVVTINLPRLAYTSKNREDFLQKVQEYTEMASRINHVKRHIIKKRIEGDHYPLYTLGFMNIKKQYSTCGLSGINEACEIMKLDIMNKDGQEFVLDILDIVNKTNSIQEKKFKYPHNVEQVPAENSSIKLAESDRIMGYNKKYSLYSNQFIPLITNADLLDRIKLQGLFDKHMTGGAICHLNVVDRITDVDFMKKLIQKAAKMGVVYFAVNYNLQGCKNDHITIGKNKTCSVCGEKIINNFTRVVGFLVNTKNFHKVRREDDYPNRVFYNNANILDVNDKISI